MPGRIILLVRDLLAGPEKPEIIPVAGLAFTGREENGAGTPLRRL